jgi:hypothetical protein
MTTTTSWATFEDCEVVRQTEKAILVDIPEAGEQKWVPKSIIDKDSEVPTDLKGCLIVPRWWALQEELVDDD